MQPHVAVLTAVMPAAALQLAVTAGIRAAALMWSYHLVVAEYATTPEYILAYADFLCGE
jgi:hypothetical protein